MHFHHRSHSCAHGEGAGGGGRGHRPFGLFGPRRRMFDQGDLRLVVLKLISEKPSHGYEIIKAVEDRLGGAYSPSPGIIYPTLTLLEEQGLIRVEFDRRAAQALCGDPRGRDAAGAQQRLGSGDLQPDCGDQCPSWRRTRAANCAGDGEPQTRFAAAAFAGPARRRADRKNRDDSRRSRQSCGGELMRLFVARVQA